MKGEPEVGRVCFGALGGDEGEQKVIEGRRDDEEGQRLKRGRGFSPTQDEDANKARPAPQNHGPEFRGKQTRTCEEKTGVHRDRRWFCRSGRTEQPRAHGTGNGRSSAAGEEPNFIRT